MPDENGNIDPPYRLDPLQTIVNVHWERKPKKFPGGSSDTDVLTPGPGTCGSFIVPANFLTCLCPGVFCVVPSEITLSGRPPFGYTSRASSEVAPPGDPCLSGVWIDVAYYGEFTTGSLNNQASACIGVPVDFEPPPNFKFV